MEAKNKSIAKVAAEYAADAPSVRLAIGKVVRRLATRLSEDLALINQRAAKPFLRALGPMGNLALGATGAAAASGVLAPAAAIVAFGAIAYYGVTNALRSEDRFDLLAKAKAQLDAAGEPTPAALDAAVQAPARALSYGAGFWRLVSTAAALRLQAVKRAAAQAAQSVSDAKDLAGLHVWAAGHQARHNVVDAKDAAVTRVVGAAAAAASAAIRKKDAAVDAVAAGVNRVTSPFVGFFRSVSARAEAIAAGVQEGARIYRERVASPAALDPNIDQPPSPAQGAGRLPSAGRREVVRGTPLAGAFGEEQVIPGFVDVLLPLGNPDDLDNRVIVARWDLVNQQVPVQPAAAEPLPIASEAPVEDVVHLVTEQPQASAPEVVQAPVASEPQQAAPVVEQPAPPKKKLSLAERMRAVAAEAEPVMADHFDDMPGPEDFDAPSPRAAVAPSKPVAPASKPAASDFDEFGAPPGMDDEPSAARSNSAALAF